MRQVKNNKTPIDNVSYLTKQSAGEGQVEIQEISKVSLEDAINLVESGLDWGQPEHEVGLHQARAATMLSRVRPRLKAGDLTQRRDFVGLCTSLFA